MMIAVSEEVDCLPAIERPYSRYNRSYHSTGKAVCDAQRLLPLDFVNQVCHRRKKWEWMEEEEVFQIGW